MSEVEIIQLTLEEFNEKGMILILGALGQLGVELTLKLRTLFGSQAVIASDIRQPSSDFLASGPFIALDCRKTHQLENVVQKYKIRQLYHLPALLSGRAEESPQMAVETNLFALFQSLEVARRHQCLFFFPSTIGVFSAESPTIDTPQVCPMRPKTIYGTTKLAGELLCDYYHHKYGLETRAIRLPGIISYKTCPKGGTTDFAVEMVFAAQSTGHYSSYLSATTRLDMVFIDDAINGIIQLMESPQSQLTTGSAYNLTAMQFSVEELYWGLKKHFPDFQIRYQIDPVRQQIADSWPDRIDDSCAREEWGWNPQYDFSKMMHTMISELKKSTHDKSS